MGHGDRLCPCKPQHSGSPCSPVIYMPLRAEAERPNVCVALGVVGLINISAGLLFLHSKYLRSLRSRS